MLTTLVIYPALTSHAEGVGASAPPFLFMVRILGYIMLCSYEATIGRFIYSGLFGGV